jgi:cytochrome d ubiquinol oxidase subunit I
MRALVIAAVAAPTAMEAGWLVTEWGRQPFVVRGMLKTADAATRAANLGPRFLVFALIYVFLATTVVTLLLGLFRAGAGTGASLRPPPAEPARGA